MPLVLSSSRVSLKQDRLSGWGGSLQYRLGPRDVVGDALPRAPA
jgi:hypothetical protein